MLLSPKMGKGTADQSSKSQLISSVKGQMGKHFVQNHFVQYWVVQNIFVLHKFGQ